jgi:hypothetical protein
VALAFVGGFLTAIELRQLQNRRRRTARKPSRGWPAATARDDLKARFIRAFATDAQQMEAQTIEETVRKARPLSTDIVLGHRDGSPVLASQRDALYTFQREQECAQRWEVTNDVT